MEHHTEVVHLTEVKFTLEEATKAQRGGGLEV